MYFPKFFHPTQLLKKIWILKPSFSNSKNLGTSANIPYFYVISENSDLTFSQIFQKRNFSSNEAHKVLKILHTLILVLIK